MANQPTNWVKVLVWIFVAIVIIIVALIAFNELLIDGSEAGIILLNL